MANQSSGKKDATTDLLAAGEAALWLSESLILALLETKVINTDTILEAIDIVIAAKKARADEGRSPDISRAAATQLASISASVAAAKAATAWTGAKRGRRVRENT